MQNIQLPDDQYDRLTIVALAAGFADVTAFVQSLAEQPFEDPRDPLSEEELAASLEMIRESEADIATGRTQDMREGLQQIAEKYGLIIQR